ncbi:MAG TPA: protein kinase [Usitatibacteraceae bacterium]|nr:protein kinase [Usitatibacteraceae bacterium]
MARILIVDDEELYLELAERTLRQAGHLVTVASSARAAVQLADNDPPDLLISDISMPDMSGFDLAAIINTDAARRWIPVIFMSSYDDVGSLREAFAVGAVDYLVKPFNREKLASTVEKKLAEASRRREADAAAGSAMPLIPGYEVISPLGEGGMGHVYLANRLAGGERCALKVLTLIDEGHGQTQQVARFLDERAMLARVDHPSVAKVIDHGICENHIYIAMEYFACGDLKLAMARGLSMQTALGYVRQIAEGLGAVHAKGIIHRDIKPANVMLRNDGSLALVDFGIAKELSADKTMTIDGELIGTPHYMSPEQIEARALDARSDLYSLGALMFELLTGRRPFNADRIEGVLMQHVHAPRPVLPDALSILQPVIDRLMAVSPKDRYANVDAFLRDFAVVEMLRFGGDSNVVKATFGAVPGLDTLPSG